MPRKQSSARLSTMAANWMYRSKAYERGSRMLVPRHVVRAFCACILANDETPGQAKRRRRAVCR